MNERIRQLADEAIIQYEQVGGKIQEPGQYYHEDVVSKFAQLIVQECANHCDLLLDHKISSEWSRGTHDCSRAIKKHFGVEE